MGMTLDDDDRFLSVRDLAELLGVPVATIYDWRVHGRGPIAHRIGKHLKFAATDVREWLASRRERPAPERATVAERGAAETKRRDEGPLR